MTTPAQRTPRTAVKAWADEGFCVNCGRLSREHLVANFSDGNMIAAPVSICPDAIFELPPAARQRRGR